MCVLGYGNQTWRILSVHLRLADQRTWQLKSCVAVKNFSFCIPTGSGYLRTQRHVLSQRSADQTNSLRRPKVLKTNIFTSGGEDPKSKGGPRHSRVVSFGNIEDYRPLSVPPAHVIHGFFELRPCVGFFCVLPYHLYTVNTIETTALVGTILPVMEAFHTIQGEGSYTGQAAYFIRLGGCDVGCSWCDVKDSWDAEAHPKLSVEAIVAEAKSHPARIAVITGGEPLMHDLGPLTLALREAGFRTHIETSGSSPLSGDWHHICFSPKKFKEPVTDFHLLAHELKVVVFNKHDLKWAEGHAARTRPDCALYLQPEWSKREEMMPLVTTYVMAHPRWRVSLQTHKYLNIP